MTTRPANLADADLIYTIKHSAYADYCVRSYGNWDENFQRTYTRQNIPYTIIIYSDEMAVGWIACKEDDTKLEIIDVHLLPSHQRKGIGSVVLLDRLAYADAAGKEVELGVLKINPSRALYERLGFSVFKETETHTLMQKKSSKVLGLTATAHTDSSFSGKGTE